MSRIAPVFVLLGSSALASELTGGPSPSRDASEAEPDAEAVDAAIQRLSLERREAEIRRAATQMEPAPVRRPPRPRPVRGVRQREGSVPAPAAVESHSAGGNAKGEEPKPTPAAPQTEEEPREPILVLPAPPEVWVPRSSPLPTGVSQQVPVPLYRRWWIWAGAGAVVAGVATAVVLAARPGNPASDPSLGTIQGNPPR